MIVISDVIWQNSRTLWLVACSFGRMRSRSSNFPEARYSSWLRDRNETKHKLCKSSLPRGGHCFLCYLSWQLLYYVNKENLHFYIQINKQGSLSPGDLWHSVSCTLSIMVFPWRQFIQSSGSTWLIIFNLSLLVTDSHTRLRVNDRLQCQWHVKLSCPEGCGKETDVQADEPPSDYINNDPEILEMY